MTPDVLSIVVAVVADARRYNSDLQDRIEAGITADLEVKWYADRFFHAQGVWTFHAGMVNTDPRYPTMNAPLAQWCPQAVTA